MFHPQTPHCHCISLLGGLPQTPTHSPCTYSPNGICFSCKCMPEYYMVLNFLIFKLGRKYLIWKVSIVCHSIHSINVYLVLYGCVTVIQGVICMNLLLVSIVNVTSLSDSSHTMESTNIAMWTINILNLKTSPSNQHPTAEECSVVFLYDSVIRFPQS